MVWFLAHLLVEGVKMIDSKYKQGRYTLIYFNKNKKKMKKKSGTHTCYLQAKSEADKWVLNNPGKSVLITRILWNSLDGNKWEYK